MYFFGFGGDIPLFFGRYRDKLERRADIATVSGLSPGDTLQLRDLYPTTIAQRDTSGLPAFARLALPFRWPRASAIIEAAE
jgi:hypothetical protein